VEIKQPYLLFLADAADPLAAKTSIGVAQWRPEACVGQVRLPGCKADALVPDMTAREAAAKGAKTMIVGAVNRGGVFSPAWMQAMNDALEAGLDLAAGLHQRLVDIPEIAAKAKKLRRKLFDVRHPTEQFPIATGKTRSGKRLLTVGTDCSIGKMYTTLALEKDMHARGKPRSGRPGRPESSSPGAACRSTPSSQISSPAASRRCRLTTRRTIGT
jgi:uncharacterized NAD-dependent epimerase/dehydratase family protein